MQLEAQTLARVYVNEGDQHHGRAIFELILELALEHRLPGATVLRGVAGFGQGSVVHRSRILRLSEALPLVVEVIETRDRLRPFLEEVQDLLGESDSGGLITLEKIQVVQPNQDSTDSTR